MDLTSLLSLKMLASLLLGVLGVGFVIAFHELGHFLFCKLFNIEVPSFSIGFGPKLFSKKFGETTYSLSSIPLGGYIESASDNSPRSIEVKPYWQKMCVVLGGIFFNLIFAYIVLLAMSNHGIPANPFFTQQTSHTIARISPNTAAEKSGLIPHDKILVINGNKVGHSLQALLQEIQAHPNETVTATIERDGKQHEQTIHFAAKDLNGKQVGSLQAEIAFESIPPKALGESFSQAAKLLWGTTKHSFLGLKSSMAKRSTTNLAGPLQLIVITIQSAGHSYGLFFLFLAFLSIGLAVLNILPFPVLDGGHMLIYTIEALLGRPLSEKFKQKLWTVFTFLLLGLFLLLTFKDVKVLFFG